MFDRMLDFISFAPYLMLGAFFLTFTVTRLAQSEKLYQVVSNAFSEDRHTKVKRIIQEMETVKKCLIGDAQEKDLSPEKQKLLNQIRRDYYKDLGSLYKKGDRNGRPK